MFARKNRFSFKKGAPKFTYASPFFIFRYHRTTDNTFRCAVVVGKKIDKRAVVRNKVKRSIVMILEKIIKNKATDFEAVFFMRRPILDILEDKEKLENTLKEAFTKTNILQL